MNQFDMTENYRHMCAKLSTDNENMNYRVYQTSSLAIYDILSSVTGLVPHKNKIVQLNYGQSVFLDCQRWATKNQFSYLKKDVHINLVQFLEELDPYSVGLVVWSDFHEITGEYVFDPSTVDLIESVLVRKKIYSLKIQSASRQVENLNSHFSLRLMLPNLFQMQTHSVVFTYQSKLKLDLNLADFQNPYFLNQLKPVNQHVYSDVISDDKELSIYNYFKSYKNVHTINDRYVLILPEISGQLLIEFLNLDNQTAFAPSCLPFWITDQFKLWWPEISDKEIMYMIVLNTQIRTDQLLRDKILKAINELKNASHWIVNK